MQVILSCPNNVSEIKGFRAYSERYKILIEQNKWLISVAQHHLGYNKNTVTEVRFFFSYLLAKG